MPDSRTHSHITEHALKLIPFDTGDCSALISDYCNYPDHYHSDPDSVLPYHFETDGVQFHYLPDPPYNHLYRYWGVKEGKICRMKPFRNEHFIHVKAGFQWYLEHAVSCVQNNEMEEGKKFLGCLLHVLEDSTFGVHALEGDGGTDIFLMNRLFDSPVLPLSFLTKISCLDCTAPEYQPVSLGNTAAEAVMNLYASYCKKVDSSRKCAFQVIRDGIDGKSTDAPVKKMFDNAVQLCADVIYTVYQISKGISGEETDLPLTELVPFESPCGGFRNYNLRTTELNRAFLPDGTEIPLELQTENGICSVENGLSFGSHFEGALRYWIAPETFREFTCRIGLHPACTGNGEIVFEIFNNGENVSEFVLDQENRTKELCVKVPGNEFSIQFHSTSSCGIVVVANSLLKR